MHAGGIVKVRAGVSCTDGPVKVLGIGQCSGLWSEIQLISTQLWESSLGQQWQAQQLARPFIAACHTGGSIRLYTTLYSLYELYTGGGMQLLNGVRCGPYDGRSLPTQTLGV